MNDNNLKFLILNAQNGDENAISKLYENNKDRIYFTCLGLLNNSDDALDVMQDTFVTVFQKIDTLESYQSYLSWQKTIAINKCKNYLIKNKPVLFSNSEIEDTIISNIEDTDSEFIPHDYIDNLEKRNEIMNIIKNNLSDVQRISILLFYYDEKSLKEIATILNCSEGTVKSRLCNSRKIIKSEIDKMEKKGVKLYSFTGIPVLSLLLQEIAKDNIISEETANGIFDNIIDKLKAIGIISSSVTSITNSKLKFIDKLTELIKGAKITKAIVAAIIIGTIGIATIALIFALNPDKDNYVATESFEAPITEQTEEVVEAENNPSNEVAQEVAKPDDPSTKTAVTKEQQNQNVANETKQTQTQTQTQQPSTPPPAPKPAAPSIATGYNANMTSAVMGLMSRSSTNIHDVNSSHCSSTPDFYNTFQSVANQYVGGSISDPSSATSNRGDTYFQATGETLYTKVKSFVFGEVTGNSADALASGIISKGCSGQGCLTLSVSYNGSTYVCRFVYANTFVTSD